MQADYILDDDEPTQEKRDHILAKQWDARSARMAVPVPDAAGSAVDAGRSTASASGLIR